MAAGVVLAVRPRIGRFAADQLVEIAAFAARGLLLVEEGEPRLVKFLEPFFPGNLLERVVLGVRSVREFQTDDAGAALAVRRAHHRRATAPRLGPFADFVVIGRRFCFGHAGNLQKTLYSSNGGLPDRVQPRGWGALVTLTPLVTNARRELAFRSERIGGPAAMLAS